MGSWLKENKKRRKITSNLQATVIIGAPNCGSNFINRTTIAAIDSVSSPSLSEKEENREDDHTLFITFIQTTSPYA
ncbi:hypothetical protein TanjilG_00616 [Lupinus angustifolius]|uniref:Uncharacterized protein n=1 Tax=Lupinus angustifolius TaxID=3871 RepID=A0A1J7HLX4_LUPAN|nr:hypothetical protein TanjilG_00616 [Lupinus angustifolius]